MQDFFQLVYAPVQVPIGIWDCGKAITDWQISACFGEGSRQVLSIRNSSYGVDIETKYLEFIEHWLGYGNRKQGLLYTREFIFMQPYGNNPVRYIWSGRLLTGRLTFSRRGGRGGGERLGS